MTEQINPSVSSIQLLQKLGHAINPAEEAVYELTENPQETLSNKDIGSSNFNPSCGLKLGELLVDFRIITRDLLVQALSEGSEYGIPLGRVLVMSGWVTQKQINWSIQLQSLLKDSCISKQIALQIADLLSSTNMTLEQALETTGCSKATNLRNTKLGDLLVEAEVITSAELEEAIHRSQYLGLPLGRALFLSGLVSSAILDTVVNAQRFIREGKIVRIDAVHAIRRALVRQELDHSKTNSDNHIYSSTTKIKLGELLVLAGIITEPQIDYAVELGLLNNMPVGKVLKDLGLIMDKTLEEALLMQVMVSEGSLSPQEAAYALIDMHYYGHSVTKAIADCVSKSRKRKKLGFKDFLAGTGILTRGEIDESLDKAMDSPYLVTKALTFIGALDEATMQGALCVHFYIKEELLTYEEAMILFDHATKNSLSVDESLKQLGLGLKMTCQSNKDNPCFESHVSNFDLLKVEDLDYETNSI